MSSLARTAGELMIDHRASPGTPEVPEGHIAELATYVCAHCQRVIVMNSQRERAREICFRCMAVICDPCHGLGFCEPFVKVAEQVANAVYHAGPDGLLLPRSH